VIDIIVLNVPAPTKDKINYVKGNSYKELEHLFNTFPMHQMIMLLDFTAEVGRNNILKQTTGNECLNQNIVLIMVFE
jgi:hypothetical protein